jgi:CHAT domain-containing protein
MRRHFLRVIPSALLLEAEARRNWDGEFVGIADPVYNTADPRSSMASGLAIPSELSFLRLLPEAQAAPSMRALSELPRLAGSGQEIQACLKALGGGPTAVTLLTGPDANLARVEKALARGASTVHFATHFLLSAGNPRQAMAALSLGADGSPELLGPDEISRARLNLRLVVLSGCNSVSAEALPSEGLMGMTRAWLAAGAGSVLATLWPTPDGQGKLLASFYTHLAQLRNRGDGWIAAEALRYAQLEMQRSSGADQSPEHWGAYMLAGKE